MLPVNTLSGIFFSWAFQLPCAHFQDNWNHDDAPGDYACHHDEY